MALLPLVKEADPATNFANLLEKNAALAGVIKLFAATSTQITPGEDDREYINRFLRFNYAPFVANQLSANYRQYRESPPPLNEIGKELAQVLTRQTRLFLLFKIFEFGRFLQASRNDVVALIERMGRALGIDRRHLLWVLSMCEPRNGAEQPAPGDGEDFVDRFTLAAEAPPADVLLEQAREPVEIFKIGSDFHVRASDGSVLVGQRPEVLPPDFLVRLDASEPLRINSREISHAELAFLWQAGRGKSSQVTFSLCWGKRGFVLRDKEKPESGLVAEVARRGYALHFTPANDCMFRRNSVAEAGAFKASVFDDIRVAGRTIDPRSLIIQCNALEERSRATDQESSASMFSLGASEITHRIGAKTIVDAVTFECYRGELTAVMGPSGCGKSTLLNLLRGSPLPKTGAVLLNSEPLQNAEIMANVSGYVPQADLLFEALTVSENLTYNAQLRAPAARSEEIKQTVERVLQQLQLTRKRDDIVGDTIRGGLSGGERKRLNIGLELLSNPAILFIDEPTSGLSSADSEAIIRLLRGRCDAGAMIFVVIHQPSAEILAMFDKLVLLDEGGTLAFFGAPRAAFQYLELAHSLAVPKADGQHLPDPAQLLDLLQMPLKNLDGSALEKRQFKPASWQARFSAARKQRLPQPIHLEVDEAHSQIADFSWRRRPFLRTFAILLRRESLNKLRGRIGWILQLVTAGVLGIAAALACRVGESPSDATNDASYSYATNDALLNYIFLSVIVCLFLSISGSVQEIIRDRPILLREGMLRIPFPAYLASKLIPLTIIYLLQLSLYLGAGFWILEIPELFVAWWLFLALVGFTGAAVGLAISTIPGLSERAAAVFVPLIIIPQIILSGADPFPFSKMEHLRISKAAARSSSLEPAIPPEIARVMPSRWAYEGLATLHRDRAFQGRYLHAQHNFTPQENSFFDKEFPRFKGARPKAETYRQALENFGRRYRERFGKPLLKKTLSQYYLVESAAIDAKSLEREKQADPYIRPMAGFRTDSFHNRARSLFPESRRLPGMSASVSVAGFDAAILLLFGIAFLVTAILVHRFSATLATAAALLTSKLPRSRKNQSPPQTGLPQSST